MDHNTGIMSQCIAILLASRGVNHQWRHDTVSYWFIADFTKSTILIWCDLGACDWYYLPI